MDSIITIEPIDEQNFGDIAVLITYDKVLLKSLSPGRDFQTAINELKTMDDIFKKEFEYITKWQTDNDANSYAIRLKNKSIGLISLSHQKGRQANVGYWLASSEWNKGYATKAFDQIINIAKKRGFTKLLATIDSSNIASKRIWENRGASFDIRDNKLITSLKI